MCKDPTYSQSSLSKLHPQRAIVTVTWLFVTISPWKNTICTKIETTCTKLVPGGYCPPFENPAKVLFGKHVMGCYFFIEDFGVFSAAGTFFCHGQFAIGYATSSHHCLC